MLRMWAFPSAAMLVCALVATTLAQDTSGDRAAPPACVFLSTLDSGDRTAKPGENGRLVDGGLLIRELFRQALLIAARDELGLSTRDMTLRESAPNARAFALTALADTGKSLTVTLRTGSGAAGPVVWQKEFPLAAGDSVDYLRLAALAERLAREDLASALRSTGLRAQPKAASADGVLPIASERRLREMTFVEQFAAVRELHEQIRTAGESPALLGGLVRGYANLSHLTAFYWNSMDKAFQARALIYAERMVVARPESAVALWHRAYARAMVGLHAAALADLAAAEQRSGASNEAAPAWVQIVKADCEYRTRDLLKLAEDGDECSQLAGLLAVRTVRYAENVAFRLRVGVQALRAAPECYPILDELAALPDLAYKDQATASAPLTLAKKLPARLAELRDLPAAGREALPAPKPAPGFLGRLLGSGDDGAARLADLFLARIPDLVAALQQAGAAERDAGEPSWQVLARMIDEVTFMQVVRRTDFLALYLCVPADDFVSEAWPLVKDHPYVSYVRGMSSEYWMASSQTAEVYKDTRFVDVRHRQLGLVFRLMNLGGRFREQAVMAKWAIVYHADALACDCEALACCADVATEYRTLLARQIPGVSPYSPVGAATLVELDWDAVSQSAAEWERRYADCPGVPVALYRKYRALGRMDDARRCLKRFADFGADYWAWCTLAYLEREAGNVARWREMLEQYLAQQPDSGLNHTRVREEIADYLMHEGKYEEALPYAEAAAKSWAQSSLQCAAACNEALGRWDRAEMYVQCRAQRYLDNGPDWFFWCVRTGHGNRAAARTAAEQWAANSAPQTASRWEAYGVGLVHSLCGRPGPARRAFEQAFTTSHDPFMGHLLAQLADEAGDAEERDKWLKEIIEFGPRFQTPAGGPRRELIELASLLQRCLAANRVTSADFEDFTRLAGATRSDFDKCGVLYFAGRFLEKHGEGDTWKTVLRRAADEPNPTWQTSLVVEHLRACGIQPEPVTPRGELIKW